MAQLGFGMAGQEQIGECRAKRSMSGKVQHG